MSMEIDTPGKLAGVIVENAHVENLVSLLSFASKIYEQKPALMMQAFDYYNDEGWTEGKNFISDFSVENVALHRGAVMSWAFINAQTPEEKNYHVKIAYALATEDRDQKSRMLAGLTLAQYLNDPALEAQSAKMTEGLQNLGLDYARAATDFPELAAIRAKLQEVKHIDLPLQG